MKKVCILLLIMFSIFITGCHKLEIPQLETGPDGEQVNVLPNGLDCKLKKLPYKMDFDGKSIIYSSVDIYQMESEHGYYPFVVMCIDLTSLTDDEIYWSKEEDSIESEVFFQSPSNDINFTTMNYVSSFDKDKYRYFVFGYFDESKKDFSDIELNCTITLKQATKDSEGFNLKNEYTYHVNGVNGDTNNYTKSFNDIEDFIQDKIVESISNEIKYLSN